MIHAVYSLFIISIRHHFVKRFFQKNSGESLKAVFDSESAAENYKVFTNGQKMSMIRIAHRFKNERLGRGDSALISTLKPGKNFQWV